jgi:hypothetical protein
MHLGLLTKPALCAPNIAHGSPVALLKRQMAPRFWFLIYSGSKKKEPRSACPIKAKASHWQRMWAEVSSSAPHFPHSGLSIDPVKWRHLHNVLYLVSSPVTTLDCSLLKDKNLTLVPRLGPDISSRAIQADAEKCIQNRKHEAKRQLRGHKDGGEDNIKMNHNNVTNLTLWHRNLVFKF